jgi:plastocyanin
MKTTSFGSKAATRTLVAAVLVSCACLLQAGAGMGALAASTTHTIGIADMKFAPETLTVSPGDTVVWVNRDFFPHTATAQDRSFDSRDIATNKSWKYVVTKKGAFPYICTLHPTMQATLIVK